MHVLRASFGNEAPAFARFWHSPMRLRGLVVLSTVAQLLRRTPKGQRLTMLELFQIRGRVMDEGDKGKDAAVLARGCRELAQLAAYSGFSQGAFLLAVAAHEFARSESSPRTLARARRRLSLCTASENTSPCWRCSGIGSQPPRA